LRGIKLPVRGLHMPDQVTQVDIGEVEKVPGLNLHQFKAEFLNCHERFV
jgi:hypothetical protein